MKIFDALFTGINRMLASGKGMLIMWFSSLLLTFLIAIPLKTWLNTVFRKSMITGLLHDGFNAEIIPDLGNAFLRMVPSFSSGLLFLALVWFIINSFFTGGIFSFLRQASSNFSTSEFFRAASLNFRSFFLIMFIMSVIITFVIIIVMILPAVIVSLPETPKEGSVFKTMVICGVISCFIMIILLLAVDYARAWQSKHSKSACFKALGFGFRQTFRYFRSSFTFMLVIVILQSVFIWISYKLLFSVKPGTAMGIFLLFLASQLLFFVKIALRIWRYAGVTVLMELNDVDNGIAKGNQDKTTEYKPALDFSI
jgi:hypothetical protein